MSNVDTPVVIIGAGPAGLTAARVLTELDIDYVLLSREKVPGENKACAGFIPFSALRPKARHEDSGIRSKGWRKR
jgi:flavin-dependent dehydrogenase